MEPNETNKAQAGADVNEQMAALKREIDTLRAQITELSGENAVLAQRPAVPVVASPVSPHAVGVGAGRCTNCGQTHPRGGIDACPVCRVCHRQRGCAYSAATADAPTCSACGSYPYLGPGIRDVPREAGRPASAYMPKYAEGTGGSLAATHYEWKPKEQK